MKLSILMFAYFLAKSYGLTSWRLREPVGGYVPDANAKTFHCRYGVAGNVYTVILGLNWATVTGATVICNDIHKRPYWCHLRFPSPPSADSSVADVVAAFTYKKSGKSFIISPKDMALVLVMGNPTKYRFIVVY